MALLFGGQISGEITSLIFSVPRVHRDTRWGEGRRARVGSRSANPDKAYDKPTCPILGFPILYRDVQLRIPMFILQVDVGFLSNKSPHHLHMIVAHLRQKSKTLK